MSPLEPSLSDRNSPVTVYSFNCKYRNFKLWKVMVVLPPPKGEFYSLRRLLTFTGKKMTRCRCRHAHSTVHSPLTFRITRMWNTLKWEFATIHLWSGCAPVNGMHTCEWDIVPVNMNLTCGRDLNQWTGSRLLYCPFSFSFFYFSFFSISISTILLIMQTRIQNLVC